MDNLLPPVSFKEEAMDLGVDIISLEDIAANSHLYKPDPSKPHQLKFYNLIFFKTGSGNHFVDFKWYPVQKNSIVYITKDQINAFDCNAGLKGFCLIFTESFFVKALAHLSKDFVFEVFNPQLYSPVWSDNTPSDIFKYLLLFEKEYKDNTSSYKESILSALFVVILSKARSLQKESSYNAGDRLNIKLFSHFVDLLETNFVQSRSALFYANLLQVSYKHLNTICKDLVHKTAKTVIDEFIVLQAKRRLINTGIKSTQLAYELGFEDATNFTKYFKKHTGLTPKMFKNSVLKD